MLLVALLIEGRASLATNFAAFKYMLSYGLIYSVYNLGNQFHGGYFSANQFYFNDFGINVFLSAGVVAGGMVMLMLMLMVMVMLMLIVGPGLPVDYLVAGMPPSSATSISVMVLLLPPPPLPLLLPMLSYPVLSAQIIYHSEHFPSGIDMGPEHSICASASLFVLLHDVAAILHADSNSISQRRSVS
jgi:hypothetical protein